MRLRDLALKTQEAYVGAVYSLAGFFHRSPDALGPEQLRQYFLHLINERKVSRSTVRQHLCGIRFLYETTLGREWKVFNLVRPKRGLVLPVVLSRGEVQRLLSTVHSLKARTQMLLGYGCGLRISEVLGLRLGRVDAERRQIHVVAGKGRKDRYVPMSTRGLQRVQDYVRQTRPADLLFPSPYFPDEPVDPKGLESTVLKVTAEAGIAKHVTFHNLRHCFATHLLDCGVDLRIIQELRELARTHQQAVLSALMTAAAAALQTLAADARFAGGTLGILAILQTWTRALIWHPHVHCLAPALALLPDGRRRKLSGALLVPVRALSPIFRAKFAEQVRLFLPGLKLPAAVWNKPWVVFARSCVEGPRNVLRYLAAYVCRGPLSDRRIVAVGNGRVTVQYRDTESGERRTVQLDSDEFLRRYLQHTLPKGFHRVRYYGFWAPANRELLHRLQAQCALGGLRQAAAAAAVEAPAADRLPPRCPRCGSLRVRLMARWWRGQLPPTLERGPPEHST